jgi:hypothetical protein
VKKESFQEVFVYLLVIFTVTEFSYVVCCFSDPFSQEDEEKADDQCRAGCCACR